MNQTIALWLFDLLQPSPTKHLSPINNICRYVWIRSVEIEDKTKLFVYGTQHSILYKDVAVRHQQRYCRSVLKYFINICVLSHYEPLYLVVKPFYSSRAMLHNFCPHHNVALITDHTHTCSHPSSNQPFSADFHPQHCLSLALNISPYINPYP